jgi:CubicO group peptidase (beta-lactamase class C family)
MMRRVYFLSVACLLTFSSGIQASPSTLAGLWQADHSESPGLSGTLHITRDGSTWTAKAEKRSARGSVSDGELTFVFGEHLGRFRGKPAGDEIDGFWMQPANGVNGGEFASPLRLKSTGNGSWSGTIVPLPSKLTLYLAISAGSDGKLGAFVKNPELGLGRGRALEVHQDGASVSLVFGKTGQVVMQGALDRSGRLHLNYPSQDLSLDFVRTTPDKAVGFLARPSADYSYHVPAAASDGWKTGSLADADIDEAAIAALVKSIAARPPGPDTPYLDSLLIARHGKLVLEEYFNGFDAASPHTLRSASKTVTGMLFGAAMAHGAALNVDLKVLPLFPDFHDSDPRKALITAGQLMSMRSGLACNDDDEDSPGNEDTMQNQRRERDWYRYTLALPMVADAGTKAAYCSAGVNLVGGVIAHATHRPMLDQLDEYLARPLQFANYYVNLMPTGEAYGGGGLTLTARDALKFGQFYLDHGMWNGKRVVAEDWIVASTTARSSLHADNDYGYNWWLQKLKVGNHVYDEWEMGGNGGQMVAVIPALDLVVGFTGENFGRFDLWYREQTDLLPNRIVPAVKPQVP